MATENSPGSRRERFNDWRLQRPFLGGILLCLAGILITWVPMQILPDIIFIGGEMTGFLAIGAMFGVFVFVTGVFALYRPKYSDMIGVVGVVLSVLSLFGSLGGLLVGMLFGILGGNLCIAWRPDDGEAASQPSKVDKAVARLRENTRRIGSKTATLLRDDAENFKQRGVDE
ncbi:DUF6114 domain-containing protein [Natronococcus wangiae]|uniref:DUF6114 domain-containing protein n=1 Tax=Natronococcus wangiae TaxID=3068275 RepID=UPI00273DECC8|nr:DUF6114 domain-containing protein [Natronococcus sp. AD5]